MIFVVTTETICSFFEVPIAVPVCSAFKMTDCSLIAQNVKMVPDVRFLHSHRQREMRKSAERDGLHYINPDFYGHLRLRGDRMKMVTSFCEIAHELI